MIISFLFYITNFHLTSRSISEKENKSMDIIHIFFFILFLFFNNKKVVNLSSAQTLLYESNVCFLGQFQWICDRAGQIQIYGKETICGTPSDTFMI